ncbi:putative uncharacterized protein Sb04g006880 [Pseudomonas sp. Os17]|nr:putative uncharacterized protein Sb04g006880 [Pseudomonas sp. Os17]
MKPNWHVATRWTANPEFGATFNDALSRRSRLAGEEARKPCSAGNGAVAYSTCRFKVQSTRVQAITRASSRPPTAG